MDINLNEIIDRIVDSKTLYEAGDYIIEFCDEAIKYNSETWVNEYVKNMKTFEMLGSVNVDDENEDTFRIISDANEAVLWYLATRGPRYNGESDYLIKLRDFGEYIKSRFYIDSEDILDEERIDNIFNILDKEYNFKDIVFSRSNVVINIIDILRDEDDNAAEIETLHYVSLHRFKHYIYLYQYVDDTQYDRNCEFVFMHELGHALYNRFSLEADNEDTYKTITDYVKLAGYPKFDIIPEAQKLELFADVLAMGMIYGTELDEFDAYWIVSDSHKEIYNKIARIMIKFIEKSM